MTDEQKISQIQKLFLSTNKANWALALQLIESQQLGDKFPGTIYHKGELSHSQKIYYLRQLQEAYAVKRVGYLASGRLYTIAEEMMEFLKHHCYPQSRLSIHPGEEGMVVSIQTLLLSEEAEMWDEKLKHLESLDKEGNRALYKVLLQYRKRQCYVNGYSSGSYDSDGWITIARKTFKPILYNFKPVNDEQVQMWVQVLLPFNP